MTFKTEPSSIRTLRRYDKGFMISDGVVYSPRAGFLVTTDCPNNYKDIIQICIDRNWLQPVAYVKDSQLFWEEFGK